VAEKYYSHDFVYRTKVGFNQPINDYFRHPLMQEMIHEMILPGIKTRGMYDYKKIESAWKDFNHAPFHKNIYLLWTAFSFEFWAQIFIDNTFDYY
jgi:asparagine synthase (glutamine-hydrolysing)